MPIEDTHAGAGSCSTDRLARARRDFLWLWLDGHFDLDVYILSMSDKSMSDQQLEILFSNLPDKCIVLMEDVDSAGLNREISRAELKQIWRDSDQHYVKFDTFANEHKTGLTLSGLLTCIDGPMSKDERIICLTSNAPDSLDPALIRSGRCNHKVLFGYASGEISTRLFKHLYTKRPDELIKGESSISEDHDITSMAREFGEAIPGGSMISPAEVQGYLMMHRQDPQAALDGVSAFATEIIETKKRGANVAKHANEVDRSGRVTWAANNSETASEDCTSDSDSGSGSDQSDEDRDCSECGHGTTKSKAGANVEGASTNKNRSSSAEEPSGGFLSQVIGVLRLIS